MTLPSDWYETSLRTGVFGPVRLGAHRSAMLDAFGPSEPVGEMRKTHTLAFRSRHLQVAFNAGRVVQFGLYFRYTEREPLALLGLALSSATSRNELLEWASRAEGVLDTETGADLVTCKARERRRRGLLGRGGLGGLESPQASG